MKAQMTKSFNVYRLSKLAITYMEKLCPAGEPLSRLLNIFKI
jgi:hypothetical protein